MFSYPFKYGHFFPTCVGTIGKEICFSLTLIKIKTNQSAAHAQPKCLQ